MVGMLANRRLARRISAAGCEPGRTRSQHRSHVFPELRATTNEPTGNTHKTSIAGSEYRHGKSPEDNAA